MDEAAIKNYVKSNRRQIKDWMEKQGGEDFSKRIRTYKSINTSTPLNQF